jgi:hypothetical protein
MANEVLITERHSGKPLCPWQEKGIIRSLKDLKQGTGYKDNYCSLLKTICSI